jgi:hypothetical protein
MARPSPKSVTAVAAALGVAAYGANALVLPAANSAAAANAQDASSPAGSQDQIAQLAGATFGGLWIDQSQGGVVSVGVAGAPDASTAAELGKGVSALVPSAKDVVVVPVQFTAGQLDDTYAALVAANARRAIDKSVVGFGIDVAMNRVTVQSTAASGRALTGALSAYVPSEQILVIPNAAPLNTKSRLTNYPPEKAGLGIKPQGDTHPQECTSSPYVHTGSLSFVLTAGHCALTGMNNWEVGTHSPFGNITATTYVAGGTINADVSKISIGGAAIGANCYYLTDTSCTNYGGVATGGPVAQGTAVKAEAYSGFPTGTISNTDFTANYGDGTTVNHLEKTTACLQPGDSGSAFSGNNNGHTDVFFGLESGGPLCTAGGSGMDAFTPWYRIVQQTGFTGMVFGHA